MKPRSVNRQLEQSNEVILLVETDEQWSFIQNKQQQWWLWYGLDKSMGKIVAYAFGRRHDASLKRLLSLIKGIANAHFRVKVK